MSTNQDAAIRSLIERVVPRLAELATAASRVSWESNTTGTSDAAERLTQAYQTMRTYHSDPAVFAELQALHDAGGSDDPVLNRQLEHLYRTYRGYQLTSAEIQEISEKESALRQRFNLYRATYQGREVTNNELEQVLHKESDVALRQEAWLATKQVGALVAEQVREMAHVRNRNARRLGFRNFCDMSLYGQEIDEQVLLQTLANLEAATEDAFTAEKQALDTELAARYGIAPEAVMPWHYTDPFLQMAELHTEGPNLDQYFAERDVAQLSIDAYDAMGLEVRDILARSDLYERPGKMQHAFCSNIDRQGDVRILCNLRNNHRWMVTQLHELGHAVYAKYIDPGLPWLVRSAAHIMTNEAIAQLMGRLASNPHWLTAFVGVPQQEAEMIAEHTHRQSRRFQLLFARWGMVVFHFERALYADPDQDLGKVWWSLVERLQQMKRPAVGDRSNDWAAKIHIANYPMYYHNYVLGEMTASQIQNAIVRDLGERWMLSDEAGAWLWKRVFRPGDLLAWNERLAVATGEGLNPAHFVRHFAS